MSLLKSLRVGSVAMLLVVSAFAADTKAPGDAPSADASKRTTRAGLTKPWNELKDLTADEKAQIIAIHRKALDQIKDIQAKEHADILAILTDDQRKEVTELIGKDKAAASEKRSKASSTTKPVTDAK